MDNDNQVTVADLPELVGTDIAPRPMLYCEVCGERYSAERGDYFLYPADHVFTCCDVPMQLVTMHTYVEPWENTPCLT